MVVLSAIMGLLVGMFLNWASDYLPRFSAHDQSSVDKPDVALSLAIWQGVVLRFVRHQALPKGWILHAAMEIVSAVVFGCLYQRHGLTSDLIVYALIFSFLLLIVEVDLKYRLVLNVLTYPAMGIVVISQLLFVRQSCLSMLLGGGLAFGIFFLTMRLKPGDLGGGDVKLATLIGLTFGFPGVLFALLTGAGSGALVAIILSLARRTGGKLYFPYAPFLCLGAMLVLIYSSLLAPV